MGEVTVKVRLTNAADEVNARRGLIPPTEVRRMEVEAVVDTGAVNCVVPDLIARQLGLDRPYSQVAQYADGREDVVEVTDGVIFEIMGRRANEECLVLGDTVLVGQTALEKTDLQVDCRGRNLIANPAHPHQSVVRVR
ncbi:MAG: clan AA aspartic protease [Armatimonadetes bacterium]|nr:clan AA aspartic protease [Armatimonadota bacterium]